MPIDFYVKSTIFMLQQAPLCILANPQLAKSFTCCMFTRGCLSWQETYGALLSLTSDLSELLMQIDFVPAACQSVEGERSEEGHNVKSKSVSLSWKNTHTHTHTHTRTHTCSMA